MWKLVTRGIRETLERRASTCRTNVYSQTCTDNGCPADNEVRANRLDDNKFIPSNIVAARKSEFCGSAKSDGPNDKQYNDKWDTGRSWSEAVGWSSVLAVGWVVCQTLCLRRRLFEPSKEEKWHRRLLKIDGAPLSVVNSFDFQPRQVLPITNCVADLRSDDGRNEARREWTAPKVFGPITIEEALKEAKDDYTKTHRIVMGEFELRFGVRALEEKRYKEALEHFTIGADLSSPGSMFNLALCHELGIGTSADAIKAAEYYRNAADRGHADAMYNLGVFHAQGKGGLRLDTRRARQLFVGAADLGQPEARRALEMEKNLTNLEGTSNVKDNRSYIISRFNKEETRTRERIPQGSFEWSSCASSEESSDDSSMKIYYRDDLREETDVMERLLASLDLETNLRTILTSSAERSDVPCYT